MPLAEADAQALLAHVRDLARGPFRERAAAADADGQLNLDNFRDLAQLGVSGLNAPADFGGLDADGPTYVRLIEALAYGDPSTAVVVNMHLLVTGIISALPPMPFRDAALRAITAGAWCCAPGSVPLRELDNADTGFRVTADPDDPAQLRISGRAGFASGSDAATYAFVGATLRQEGQEPQLVLCTPLLSDPAVHVQHNWDAMGLRSTASHDILLDDYAVARADCFIVPVSLMRMAEQLIPPLQLQRRALPAFGICAIWLGNAQAMFDETIPYLRQRRGYLADAQSPLGGSQDTRDRHAWAQMALGSMDSWLHSARTVLYDAVGEIEHPRPVGQHQDFIRLQVRTTHHLRRMAEEIALTSIKTTGAHAYVKGHILERLYRDLTGGIVMAWKTDELQHNLGLAALGEDIQIAGPAGT